MGNRSKALTPKSRTRSVASSAAAGSTTARSSAPPSSAPWRSITLLAPRSRTSSVTDTFAVGRGGARRPAAHRGAAARLRRPGAGQAVRRAAPLRATRRSQGSTPSGSTVGSRSGSDTQERDVQCSAQCDCAQHGGGRQRATQRHTGAHPHGSGLQEGDKQRGVQHGCGPYSSAKQHDVRQRQAAQGMLGRCSATPAPGLRRAAWRATRLRAVRRRHAARRLAAPWGAA